MKKRIFAAFLCIVMLFASLANLSACSENSKTVMTVGDYKVSYAMLRYFVMNYMNGYENVTPEDFASNEHLQEQLYNNVISSISELATYSLLAEKHEIILTSEEKKEIKNSIKELKNSYESKKDYEKDLEANYMTEALLEEIYTLNAKCDKLYDKLADEYTGIFKSDVETIDADIEAGNFFSAEYIVFYYTDNNKEEREEVLQGLLDRSKAGEKMRDLLDEAYKTYGEHIAYELYTIFTYHEKTEIFEDTVVSLDIGSYSDVVDTGNSFIIVHRLPLDMDYIDKNYNTVIAKYLSREFFTYVEEFSNTLEVVFKEKYKDIKMWEME
ncbi:MAG: hypothetical protein E7633_02855 [Ruminococcaceae bacterium]|nr:hypothetical protein [Oscillospiraceae bacterium]